MRSRPPKRERGYYNRLADLIRISGTSREAVLSVCRLRGRRVIGNWVWFSEPMSLEEAQEIVLVEKMIRARETRRADDHKAALNRALAAHGEVV